MRKFIVGVVIVVGACSFTEPRQRSGESERDVPSMMSAKYGHRVCGDDVDCPFGTHCEDDACTYECTSDDGCADGLVCSDGGSCVLGIRPFVRIDDPVCAQKTDAEKLATLVEIFNHQKTISCVFDASCPCGSFCDNGASECAVECSNLPNSTLTCDDPQATCDPLGHCVTVADPPPTVQLALVMAPTFVSGDTHAGPVAKTVDVSVDALDIAFATSPHPATVIYSVVGVDGVEPPPDPTTVPQIRCPSGTFASRCEIDGGWTFGSGSIHSATRTIDVRLPRSTTVQTWTLEATSDWAGTPTTAALRADPVNPPPTVAGRYDGTLTLTRPGGTATTTPVTAVITNTAIALVEPSSTVLPDGHADFARSTGKVTMVRWLSSTINGYDARIALGALAQDAQTGRVSVAGTLALGVGAASTIAIALDRTGDLEPAACSADSQCASATYCDAVVQRCVTGHGPAAGAGIVDATSSAASPSTTLSSAAVAAWRPFARSLRAGNPAALGAWGYEGVVQAYCARATPDAQPPRLDIGGVFATASLDTLCKPWQGDPYLQTMFPFADATREFQPGVGTVLQDQCNADLALAASASLAPRSCVSLARFYAALEADQDPIAGGGTGSNSQRLLIAHVLREWLGLNGYLAGTAVQAQDAHDILADDQMSRQARLAAAADVMEQSLGVLLDPIVRPQFTSGSQIPRVTQSPDYRVPARPVARWTFNTSFTTITSASIADAEGTNAMSLSYSGDANGWITLANNKLSSGGTGGTRSCHTSAPVTLDDTSFSISAALRYVPFNNQTVTLLDKHAANGNELKLDATTTNLGANLTLTLHDSSNRAATFTIPWLPASWGTASLLAVVAEEGHYRVHIANGGTIQTVAASSVTNGGPRWGDAGIVDIACQATGPASCMSVDRVFVGDHLDVSGDTGWCDQTAFHSYTCDFFQGHPHCLGVPPSHATTICPAAGNGELTFARNQATAAGALPAAVAAITVSSGAEILDEGSAPGDNPGEGSTWVDWDCEVCIGNYPAGITGNKPVCGAGTGVLTEWDEVALWSHSLSTVEFTAMVNRYTSPGTQTVPPPSQAPAGDEQKAGLPVYLIESVDADLQLVASYLAAEDDIVYGDCYLGRSSTELPIAVARAARHLRLAAVLEAEAAQLASLADASATWRARYTAALQVLGARRTAVIRKLQALFACTSSLGITDDEVPVYAGGSATLDPKARFFAGSAFLVAKAHDAIWGPNGAEVIRTNAQNHYRDARMSEFNIDRAATEKQDRINALTASAEDQLRRSCGTKPPTANHPFPLFEGLGNGTLMASSCFIKLEDPACAAPGSPDARKLGSIPDGCLRGEIGERIIAIKTALKNQQNAKNSVDRAQALYDNQTKYCVETVQVSAQQASNLLAKHQATMTSIHNRIEELNLAGSFLDLTQNMVMGNAAAFSNVLDLALGGFRKDYLDNLQDENDKYDAEVLAAKGNDALEACKHTAEQMKPTIDAALDASSDAALETQAAVFAVVDNMSAVTGIVQAATGQIALENTINRTPPQLHYWLDQDIAEYGKQMAYARRLTYLAVRAFDYEAQRDSGKRGRVLAARTPLELSSVLTEIDALQGELGFNQNSLGLQPVFPAITLSLRDEIMSFHPPAGMSPAAGFAKLVKADENRIFVTGFDGQQHLLGHGIRFALAPDQAWNNLLCDERTWRITIHPEITGRSSNLSQPFILFQRNAFSSQTCRLPAGNVTTTLVRQKFNLFTNDDPPAFATADPFFNAPMTIPSNLTKEILGSLPQDSSILDGSLAGRGLYGEYILVFPACDGVAGCSNANGYTDSNLDNLADVTIRIDMSAANNVPNTPSN